MYAAESNAPEGRGAQAPGPGAVMNAGRSEAPGPRGEAPARRRPPPETTSAPPRWSCRHPVRGRVSRPRGARGAYNTELAAAKGRSPEGGGPAARGTAGKNFLKKVLDTVERAR